MKKNILIVGGDRKIFSFLYSHIKDRYNVFYAFNGREAFKKLKLSPKPNVIISDEMDGYDFYSAVMEDSGNQDIPFIFITAKNSIQDKIKVLQKGAVDYVCKPFVVEELIAKIDSILQYKAKVKKSNLKRIEKELKKVFNDLSKNSGKKAVLHDFDIICNKNNISPREKKVLNLLLMGLLNKEISDRLKISIRTVEFHLHNIYKKFGVQNKIELLMIFYKKLSKPGN